MRLVFNYRPVNHLSRSINLAVATASSSPFPFPPPPPLSSSHILRPLSSCFARSRARKILLSLSGQITPHDLRCNLQSAVRMYILTISPCKYATLFRMRMHSRLSFLSFLLLPFFFFFDSSLRPSLGDCTMLRDVFRFGRHTRLGKVLTDFDSSARGKL